MSSPGSPIQGARLLQELGLVTLKLSMAEEQIAQLQQQNAAIAKQLREALEENSKLKLQIHAETHPEATPQEAAAASN